MLPQSCARRGRATDQPDQGARRDGGSVAAGPSRDPRDDFLLALSEAAKADLLVTGDKDDLLSLERHGSTAIVTAASFGQTLGV
jgi:hypothetical protein